MNHNLPKANRIIVMVRHGQYNLECTQDENGNEVKSKNIKLFKTPMTRATETANSIFSLLPDTVHSNCDLLREGAPYW